MAERFGKGNVERIGNLWVLHLKGTSFERGLQHGTLMRYRVRETIGFYRNLPETLAGRALLPGSLKLKALMRLKRGLVGRFTRNRDSDALEEMRGLAVGLGVREEELAEALVLADVFQIVGAMAERGRRAGPPVIPGFGCTSAIRETPEGLLFARNFDFWGAGYWDTNPAIIFHHPDKGKAFCSIATAGLPTGGITSINEDGLAIAVHQLGSRDSSMQGTPIIDIAHGIARNAGSVDEAIEIAASAKATGGWTIVVGGGKTRTAAAIEMTSAGIKVRYLQDHVLVATNIFRDPELIERELTASVSATLSDQARFSRATELAASPRVSPSHMAGILGDHFDVLAGRERSAGFTISRISNISSVLFSLGDNRFWVSESAAPTSKGGFVGFDLDTELGGTRSSIGRLEGARAPRARTTTAQDLYLEAYKQYISSGDLNEVHAMIGECVKKDGEEPTFHFMEGILRAMLGNLKGALSSLDRALELERVEPKKLVELLWKARILDLMDRREASEPIYGELSGEDSNPRLIAKAATRGRRHAYREKELGRVLLDFTNGDTFE
ncbi:MAG: C45 family autoproteolytic acyltransferase/hydrolase [Candidatus Geothermincolia bacterium]